MNGNISDNDVVVMINIFFVVKGDIKVNLSLLNYKVLYFKGNGGMSVG